MPEKWGKKQWDFPICVYNIIISQRKIIHAKKGIWLTPRLSECLQNEKKYSDTVFHIENVILRLQLLKVTLFIYRVTLNPGLSRLHLVSQCNFSLSFAAMSWFEQLVIWSLIYMAICDNKRQFHDTLWYKAPKLVKYVNLAGANSYLTWILPTGKIN